MSGQFSAPVNKWLYYSPKARASVTLCGKRGRSMTAIIGAGSVGHLWSPSGSITPVFTAVFAPSLLFLLLFSVCSNERKETQKRKHQQFVLFLRLLCVSANTDLAPLDFKGKNAWWHSSSVCFCSLWLHCIYFSSFYLDVSFHVAVYTFA